MMRWAAVYPPNPPIHTWFNPYDLVGPRPSAAGGVYMIRILVSIDKMQSRHFLFSSKHVNLILAPGSKDQVFR